MTDKQKLFVAFYLESLNGTKAAIAAGYSEKTAGSIGQRLLKNIEIRTAIDNRLAEIESEKIVKAKEILEFLSATMRGEITEEVVVQVGGKSDIRAELLTKPLCGKDRLKAAELLARINGLFAEKTEPKIDAAQILIDTLSSVWRDRESPASEGYNKVSDFEKSTGHCTEKKYCQSKKR